MESGRGVKVLFLLVFGFLRSSGRDGEYIQRRDTLTDTVGISGSTAAQNSADYKYIPVRWTFTFGCYENSVCLLVTFCVFLFLRPRKHGLWSFAVCLDATLD